MERLLHQCPDCKVWTSNEDHICVEYDAEYPCAECGAPTVYVTIAAPGTGCGRECQNGHYDGTCRELTKAEVV